MEPNQFEEITKQFEILKSENTALKKDIKLIKNILITLSVLFALYWVSYGAGVMFGLIEKYFLN
ncbi:MAG TPA: hypothetical protein PLH91_12390 [Tenuifilaceae bacterium]|nr:hypothetical protein [Tenuifilaceae bacterium]HOZ15049.1 hypothetical protein [Tenuifilaceae bacterium]HPI46026.1 hypothetical protein [Tenuifilaceae bacterium]HPN20645.1 hypothetical protein [Tenuifilaceae bacterium]